MIYNAYTKALENEIEKLDKNVFRIDSPLMALAVSNDRLEKAFASFFRSPCDWSKARLILACDNFMRTNKPFDRAFAANEQEQDES